MFTNTATIPILEASGGTYSASFPFILDYWTALVYTAILLPKGKQCIYSHPAVCLYQVTSLKLKLYCKETKK